MYNPAQLSCFFRMCQYCPDNLTEFLISEFKLILGEIDKESVTFQQWLNIEKRCSLETVVKTLPDYVSYIVEPMNVLITHSFVSFQQSAFLKEKKENLKIGEFLVQGDYSKNHSFHLQNEAQSYYFSKKYATIHPFVVYYKKKELLEHLDFIIISECLRHDATAVYLFIKLIKKLNSKFGTVQKIYYVTDGAGSQYKNKYNLNLYVHTRAGFRVLCWMAFSRNVARKGLMWRSRWNAQAKSYKREPDSTIKDQITNAKQLFDWAKSSKIEAEFDFSSERLKSTTTRLKN